VTPCQVLTCGSGCGELVGSRRMADGLLWCANLAIVATFATPR
jgi:hypothetical protein